MFLYWKRNLNCCKFRFFLCRFIKARKYDIKKTAEMWKNMLAWRTEFGTDTIDEVVVNLQSYCAWEFWINIILIDVYFIWIE